MKTIEENLSEYCLGLVVYTYENLLARGKNLVVLLRRVRQVFPELDMEQVRVVRAGVDQFEVVEENQLQASLEIGEISRFEIFFPSSNDNQPTGLIRAFLGGAQTNPVEPNYIFFGIPATYFAEKPEDVNSRLITVGREVFDFLNGVYGFAHLGFLDLMDDATLPPLEPPLAIPPIDFRDLYIPADLRNEIPYLFWANWFGRSHVDRFGGLEIIQQTLPFARVDRMSRGALLVTSYPTPLVRKNEVPEEDLDALASFLVTPLEDRSTETADTIKNGEDTIPGQIKPAIPPSPEEHTRQTTHELERMAMHVKKFEEDYLQKDKAPRNYVWRPYRFCTQDIVLGLTVVRHSVDNNCLEVDVCLTSELSEFEEGSSARVMWSFLLSEAFKCGGTMEIRFVESERVRRPVPHDLAIFAKSMGAPLAYIEEGRVTPTEARRVYLAITQFIPTLRDQILKLAGQRRLSTERACYAVHRGLWTQPELAQIVLGAPRADRILSGETLPEHRLLYRDDISHARSALLGGFLDRKLMKRIRDESGDIIDHEDDVLPLEIDYKPDLTAKVYSCPEPFSLPWLATGQMAPPPIAPSTQLIVLIRAREREELDLVFESDLELAARNMVDLTHGNTGVRTTVLVPRDFEDLPSNRQTELVDLANRLGIPILVCPETTISLDTEAIRRFSSSRIIRE